MYAGIVVLYEPESKKLYNINTYYAYIDILIVLDNSLESHREKLNDICGEAAHKLKYEHLGENIGLCAAFNKGIEIAKQAGCSWAILMDDDSSLITNCVGVYDNYITQHNVSNVVILAPVHIYDRSSNKSYPGNREISWAMTSGCFYRIDVFEKLGGFFEELFVECLDLDYCFRAKESGFKIIECGEALIKHHPGETRYSKLLGLIPFKYGKATPWRYYMQIRSLTWLFLRFHKLEVIKLGLWKWIKVLLFFENKKQYLMEMKKGIIEGISIWQKYRINR